MTFEIFNSNGVRMVDNIPFSELEKTLRRYLAYNPTDLKVLITGNPHPPSVEKGYSIFEYEKNNGGDYDPPLCSVISDQNQDGES